MQPPTPSPTPSNDFDDLIDDLIRHECDSSPTLATQLGIDGYAHLLDDHSPEAYAARDRATRTNLAAFTSVDPTTLTPAQRIDQSLVISALAARTIETDTGWEPWRQTPEGYVETGITDMYLAGTYDPDDFVDAACARLRAIPQVLSQAATNLDPTLADPLILTRSLAEARADVDFATHDVLAYAHSPAAQSALAQAGAFAANAYQRFADHLTALIPRATGSYIYTAQRYDAMLATRELLDYDTASLGQLGAQVTATIITELTELSIALTGSPDWQATSRKLQRNHARSLEALCSQYAASSLASRHLAAARGLITLPANDKCLVSPAPRAIRATVAVACYILPPFFKPTTVGHFLVPYPVDETDSAAVTATLESNASYTVATTAAHETYPGHHYHLMAMQHARPVRKFFTSDFFMEGWGLYAEAVMDKVGFYTPTQRFGFLECRLLRAARIVVDTALHTGTMTQDQATHYMHTQAMLPLPVARTEVERYCAYPTNAASYLTGCLALEAAAQDWTASARPLGDFHARLVTSGCLPIPLALATLADD